MNFRVSLLEEYSEIRIGRGSEREGTFKGAKISKILTSSGVNATELEKRDRRNYPRASCSAIASNNFTRVKLLHVHDKESDRD